MFRTPSPDDDVCDDAERNLKLRYMYRISKSYRQYFLLFYRSCILSNSILVRYPSTNNKPYIARSHHLVCLGEYCGSQGGESWPSLPPCFPTVTSGEACRSRWALSLLLPLRAGEFSRFASSSSNSRLYSEPCSSISSLLSCDTHERASR